MASRGASRANPAAAQATKKLTTFHQMILLFMTFAMIMLFSANYLMHQTDQQVSKPPPNHYYRVSDVNNRKSEQNSIAIDQNVPLFDQLQQFQTKQLLHPHDPWESTSSTESRSNPEKEAVFSTERQNEPESHEIFEEESANKEPLRGREGEEEIPGFQFSPPSFSSLPETELPGFSIDYSEFVFNSLIEIANEKFTKYYLTAQLLSHYNLRPSEIKRLKILKSSQSIWENALNQFQDVKYYPNGKRREKPYLYCRVSYPKWDSSLQRWFHEEEMIAAEFIPNRLSTNPSVNKRIDVMRCPLNETTYQSFLNHIGSLLLRKESEKDSEMERDRRRLTARPARMAVEIIKDDKPILHYTIDIRSRMTGYLMNFIKPITTSLVPTSSGVLENPVRVKDQLLASQLSIWPEIDYDNYYNYNLFNFSPKIFLCIPQIIKPISHNNIALLLEFVAHHLVIGFDHIFLPTIWAENTPHYQRFIQLFASYINEGKVSIISQASNYGKGGEISENPSSSSSELKAEEIPFEFYGIVWDKFFLKTLQANSILYSSKGISDYVLYLDIDQFFIPKLSLFQQSNSDPQHLMATILLNAVYSKELLNYGSDLLIKMKEEEEESRWKGGSGWADKHHHPLCYLSVGTEAMLSVKGPKQYDRNWLGILFHHGTEKEHNDSSIQKRIQQDRVIVPTRTIYYTGSYHPGVCRLSWQWNGCHDPNEPFCYSRNAPPMREASAHPDTISGPLIDHRFDEVVLPSDGKRIAEDEAVIYHYSYYDRRVSASAAALQEDNLYTETYFPLVYQDLAKRGLALLIDLPESVPESILGKNKKLNVTILSSKDVTNYDVKMENDELDGTNVLTDLQTTELLTDFTVHIPKAEITSLPSFATDLSEIVLHAMIERTSNAYDLFITVFLLNHQFVHLFAEKLAMFHQREEGSSEEAASIDMDSFVNSWKGIEFIHPNIVPYWQEILSKFEETSYDANQAIRMTKPSKNRPMDVTNRQVFKCRIRNMVGTSAENHNSQEGEYVVDAVFVPHYFMNAADERKIIQVDILRCPMGNAQFLYRKYSQREDISVQVEIIKNDLSIIHFLVPWKERNAGLMTFPSYYSYDAWEHHLFHQEDANSADAPASSHQKHHGHHVSASEEEEDDHETDRPASVVFTMGGEVGSTSGMQLKETELLSSISSLKPVNLDAWNGFSSEKGFQEVDKVYIAVLFEEKDALSYLLEFLEYYLTVLHVNHVIIGYPFSWISSEIKLLLRILKPYLFERKVTVVSLMDPSYHTSAADAAGSIDSSNIVKTNFLLGAILSKQTMHHLFSNICLYYTKGLVELLGILKLSDFIIVKDSFTPSSSHSSGQTNNVIYEAIQKSMKSDGREEKKVCSYKFPRKTLIHVRAGEEEVGSGDVEDNRIFRFLPPSSADLLLNSSIVLLKNDYSSPESYLIPTGRIYYISTLNAGGSEDEALRATQLYACKLPFPFHGCNDRTDFCLQEDEANHSPPADTFTPVYFNAKTIPDASTVLLKEDSLSLWQLQAATTQELTKQDLVIQEYSDNTSSLLFPSFGNDDNNNDNYDKKSFIAGSISKELIHKERLLSFVISDSLSTSEIRLYTQLYHKQLLTSFARSLHVKQEQSSASLSGLEILPSLTRDLQAVLVAALWEVAGQHSPSSNNDNKIIMNLAHLVISPESSYWTDFSSIAASISTSSSTSLAAWKTYDCKATLDDHPVETKTLYEDLADGIGIIRCELTIPKELVRKTTAGIAGKVNLFRVSLLKPRGLLRSESASEVLKYEISDREIGKGLLFPERLSFPSSSSSSSEGLSDDYGKSYLETFFPSSSLLLTAATTSTTAGGRNISQTTVNLCYSVAWENILTKQSVSLLIESLVYHYSLGIHHIFLTIRLYSSLPSQNQYYDDKLLYLQLLHPFFEKKQLTVFFLDDSETFSSSSSSSFSSILGEKSSALTIQMIHHFEFIQQYSMTLSLLLTRNQGVSLLSYWKVHQLLVLPPIFEGKRWKNYWKHHNQHHQTANNQTTASLARSAGKNIVAATTVPELSIGFAESEADLNKPGEAIGKQPNKLEEFIEKMISLPSSSSSSSSSSRGAGKNNIVENVERYFIFHSLPIPTRELTNHLLFHENNDDGGKEGGGGDAPSVSSAPGSASSSSSSSSVSKKQFLGDIYQTAPNYYQYYYHYYSLKYFQNQLDDYPGYLSKFCYDSTLHDDPTKPFFDFGIIVRLALSSSSASSSSLGSNSAASSPFLEFLWHNYLPSSHKGKTIPREFLARERTTVIHFSAAELYSYYDYQNLYNLQQTLVKTITMPSLLPQNDRWMTTNKKKKRLLLRKRRRQLAAEGAKDRKDVAALLKKDESLLNQLLNNHHSPDALFAGGKEGLHPPAEAPPAGQQEHEPEEEEEEGEEEGSSNFSSFFSKLITKMRKSASSAQDIEAELSSFQQNQNQAKDILQLQHHSVISKDQVHSSSNQFFNFPSPLLSSSSSSAAAVGTEGRRGGSSGGGGGGRTNSFQTIFAYYQRKDQHFTNKLNFLYFQNIFVQRWITTNETTSSSQETTTTATMRRTLPERSEITIERNQEKQQLLFLHREEILQGYATTFYYEQFMKNKVDLLTFLTEDHHDGRSSSSASSSSAPPRPVRSNEQYAQLLQQNIYSHEDYEKVIGLLYEDNYDLILHPTQRSRRNRKRSSTVSNNNNNKGNKAISVSFLSSSQGSFADFLTVFKTRLTH